MRRSKIEHDSWEYLGWVGVSIAINNFVHAHTRKCNKHLETSRGCHDVTIGPDDGWLGQSWGLKNIFWYLWYFDVKWFRTVGIGIKAFSTCFLDLSEPILGHQTGYGPSRWCDHHMRSHLTSCQHIAGMSESTEDISRTLDTLVKLCSNLCKCHSLSMVMLFSLTAHMMWWEFPFMEIWSDRISHVVGWVVPRSLKTKNLMWSVIHILLPPWVAISPSSRNKEQGNS